MSLDDLERQILRLEPAARARLAEKLLASLENLSDEENLQLWAEEAERRDNAWPEHDPGLPAEDVIREARARLK